MNNLRFRGNHHHQREWLYFFRKLKAMFWSQIVINFQRAAIESILTANIARYVHGPGQEGSTAGD